VSAAVRRSFDSLSVPNYRRYFAGQLVSLSGTWMQTVAAIWLVLTLTDSGVAVGLTTALQFLPMLLFGAWGGLLADRIPKRRLLIATQALMAIPAIGLLAVTATGVVAPWMVFLAVFAMGLVNAVDNPTRQSFVFEMVGPDRVVNAVALNSVVVHSSRILGPALAGAVIALIGIAPCFLVNAFSFLAMFIALRTMNPRELQTPKPAMRKPGEVKKALRYVRGTPELLIPLLMMALVGALAYEFQVVLPVLARETFGGGAEVYGFMTAGEREWTASNTMFEGGMGIDATVPFGYESDFMRPVYPVDRVDLKKWFNDKDIQNAKSRMHGWVHSLARTGR